jgi:hypothetical protein
LSGGSGCGKSSENYEDICAHELTPKNEFRKTI